MPFRVFQNGSRIRLEATFTDVNGTPINATNIRLRVKNGIDGAETIYTGSDLTQIGTGNYYIDIDVDDAGLWRHRWESTGVVKGAEEHQFEVRASDFP